ncbi:MAG: glycoside hydrolase family 43 protein [Acidimicrobiales bacterium]
MPAPSAASASTTAPPAAPQTIPSATTAPPPLPADFSQVDISGLRTADAPDPFVAVDHGEPWLFTTNSAAGNVPMATTTTTDGRLLVADALAELPPWAEEGHTWAPAVTPTEHGWVLAFTARDRASGRQCIGVATAPSVHGPYTPAPSPLVCHPDQGGSIDPSFVVDPVGRRWLLYKDDGNCCGLPTTLHSVPLAATATELFGPPADLLTANLAWEGGLIEAPTMARVGNRWLLLYSANRWDTPAYAVGVAWCDTPMGPCTKQPEPALAAGAGLEGPGGVEFVSGNRRGDTLVTFHAWPEDAVGYTNASTRRLHLGRVDVTPTIVTILPRPIGR